MSIKHHIPNYLTYSRIAAVPLLLAAWYLPISPWIPLIILIFASITDFFDGYLARKWGVESELGRLLDPNADKMLIAVALILLAVGGYAHPIAVSLIICREIFISGLREFMAERNVVVHVTKLAKWKTTSQMAAVILLLFIHGNGQCNVICPISEGILWLSTALTLLTGWQYFRGAIPHLTDK